MKLMELVQTMSALSGIIMILLGCGWLKRFLKAQLPLL